MRFHPNYPNDNNRGQRLVWHALKNTFERDEGVAYYRYPIFTGQGRGRSEPDFLMIHREFGVWVLESKGCSIGHIAAIEGHEWIMRDWYSESMAPVSQADRQLFRVKDLVEGDPVLKGLNIPLEFRVALPLIKAEEWALSGYARHPSTDGVVWLDDDLEPARLRAHVRAATKGYMPEISDTDWERLLGVFRGVVSDNPPREPVPGSPPISPSRVIHGVESRLRVLDDKQDRVAQEVPDGPQRIRGLAGTGKTVLFARRAAWMHARKPEWDIAFVYFSRALGQQIRGLIADAFRRMTGETPNWDKLRVWHAWGEAKGVAGFGTEVAKAWDARFHSLKQAKTRARDGETEFAAACRDFEKKTASRGTPFLDAILIDEGQDLPAAFYRIAHRALRPPQRLYWAYDEAQGVDSLIVPTAAEVFGRDEQGNPLVDLAGMYRGMQKAHNLNRCYRTPRLILTAAHAINMGLLRAGGPIQGVTTKEDWEALGYRVVEGDFSAASVKARRPVVIERPPETTGHPIDEPGFDPALEPGSILEIHTTRYSTEDVELVATGIERDLEAGLRPEDIAVVSLEPFDTLKLIQDRLATMGVQALLLDNTHKDGFRLPGHVTLSWIRRAKGNEAYKVYAVNLHSPDLQASVDEEMVERNRVFVALTRTKLWCVALGREGTLMRELQAAKDQAGRLAFPAFNQASLRRSMDDREGRQQDLFGG